ncbi:hypothetical protein QZM97_19550 [Burkholderia orbicola]|uniref:Uncharacterized protein n=1 Tax=Burkholderia orbicola TaxID=2978683 RepID=A0ABT8NTZ1_9BURK|nr:MULTISPECIES: LPO_1073/Vpar_1526 family protein [Burkholderia]MDN7525042.1 hypothetical protein [Burkholderia orbicola]MDN7777989.1 hypothetical protein [Burkholderia orbicola]MDN7992274.1 hypothetical protein [Burkholderia orbicola]UJH71869.1 hypothetical protein L0U95_08370 [Burkholderia cenocepacia]
MIGDKQDQTAATGAVAIQAGRDVNYHGLSVAEVRELCALFLRSNFPELREEAKRTAEQHVRDFASTLEQKLIHEAASIVLDKFREPDVQAAVNDAVQASARKGTAANPQVLSSLIAERVSTQSTDYKDTVLSEAVTVVPKLTAPQIALISFYHFVTSVTVNGLPSAAGLEAFARPIVNSTKTGFDLSISQKQHIQYAGACSINAVVSGDIYEAVRANTYAYFGYENVASFKEGLSKLAPSYLLLLDQFTKENLFTINLTSVGQAIAIANLSAILGKLDYSIWLK